MAEPLTLTELVDLEVASSMDRAMPSQEVRDRDRRIGAELQARIAGPIDQLTMAEILRNWLRQVVPSPTPGQRLVGFLALSDLFLMVIGFVLGASLAGAVLYYDGTSPINAIQYLGTFVVLQGVLVLLLLVSLALGNRWGVVQEGFRSLAYFRSHLFERMGEGLTTLRRMRRLYSRPEFWLILKVTQKFGVAFNAGALVVAFYLVGFTDLAFSWSTTLDLSAQDFHRWLRILGTPWEFLGERWQLNSIQVEATQYFRLDGKYAGHLAPDPVVAGMWWRYLLAAHFFYGMLPRLLLFVVSVVGFRRSLGSIRFEGIVWGSIRQRLLESQDMAAEPEQISSGARESNVAISGPCRVLLWRDFPCSHEDVSAYIKSKTGAVPQEFFAVGGNSKDADGRKIAASGGNTPWVLMVEDWESPGKAFKKLLQTLRQNGDPDILVMPTAINGGAMAIGGEEKLTVWRRHVDGLADPHVGVLL